MNNFQEVCSELSAKPKSWLVTGCAGFIGSNLIEKLLQLDQVVIGLDNFSTGHKHNLDAVRDNVTKKQWARFSFKRGDIRDLSTCIEVMSGAHYVLHQAALGSVPRSIENPLVSHDVNVNGHLNILEAAKRLKIHNVVYAASSSTYGDHPSLPKMESVIGNPLSPYAVTKYINELYALNYNMCYGINTVGLRYFNVYGRRQDPKGAYAAVIPMWAEAMINNEPININGDGKTSRDFCYIDNVVQANILAAIAPTDSLNQVYNIACGERNTLNKLFDLIKINLADNNLTYDKKPVYRDFRTGDVRHSEACIDLAKNNLGFNPEFNLSGGLSESIAWYIHDLAPAMA